MPDDAASIVVAERPAMDVPQLIAAAIDDILAGDMDHARALLRGMDHAGLIEQRTLARALARSRRNLHSSGAARLPVRRSSVPNRIQRSANQRDRFICRYCGHRTIDLEVLKCVSLALPDALPYRNGQWRPVEEHLVYWTYSASIEHHIPLARGGTNDASNILTTCYQCNDAKRDSLIEELGWSLLPVEETSWDGLTARLKQLRAAIRRGASDERARTDPPTAPTSATVDHFADKRKPLSTSGTAPRADVAELVSSGALVQAVLPGKKTARNYRVDSVEPGILTLREMWQRDADRAWVASKRPHRVSMQDLHSLRVVRTVAPREGSCE